MPGVTEVLARLRDMGVPMRICTNNARAPLLPVPDKTGLGDWVEIVVAGGDDLPTRKPEPEPLLMVLRDLGQSRGVFVGDGMVDAQTARAAAVPFALFTEGIRSHSVEAIPHDAAFSDFACLCEVYERLR